MFKTPVFLALCVTFFYHSFSFAHEERENSHHQHPYSSMVTKGCSSKELRCANAATAYFASDGSLWVSWTAGGSLLIAKSITLGKSFDTPKEIAQHGQYLDTGPDARPQIVGDAKGNLLVAYDFFKDNHWNGQINMIRSTDGGRTFSTPEPFMKKTFSQRFPSLLTNSKGHIFMAWVDKRKVAEARKKGDKKLGGAIAYAWSQDSGKHFQTDFIANEESCECCRLGVAMSEQGLPVLMYRALFAGGVRDHASQFFIDATQPGDIRRVSNDNWKTDSCPHHGPSIAVASSGILHAAWFTNGQTRSGVFYASSKDKGATYSEPRRVGHLNANIGRPYVLALGKEVWLVWKEFDGKQASIYLEHSSDEGSHWEKKLVASTTGYSDHPLLLHTGQSVFLSWLTREKGYQLIPLNKKVS